MGATDTLTEADETTEERGREVRAIFGTPPELRADGDDDDAQKVLFGHFARFNEWNEIYSWRDGRFLESVAPGAYAKTFAERGPGGAGLIKVLFNHGYDPAVGKQSLGVPTVLREDAAGPYYETPLFRAVPPLLLEGLEAEAYGASYMFEVIRDAWNREPEASGYNPNALPERTIQEVKLYELGPVTFPADEGASAGVRSLTDHFRTLATGAPLVESTRRNTEAAKPPAPKPPTEGTTSSHSERVAFLRAAQLRNRK